MMSGRMFRSTLLIVPILLAGCSESELESALRLEGETENQQVISEELAPPSESGILKVAPAVTG